MSEEFPKNYKGTQNTIISINVWTGSSSSVSVPVAILNYSKNYILKKPCGSLYDRLLTLVVQLALGVNNDNDKDGDS